MTYSKNPYPENIQDEVSGQWFEDARHRAFDQGCELTGLSPEDAINILYALNIACNHGAKLEDLADRFDEIVAAGTDIKNKEESEHESHQRFI